MQTVQLQEDDYVFKYVTVNNFNTSSYQFMLYVYL